MASMEDAGELLAVDILSYGSGIDGKPRFSADQRLQAVPTIQQMVTNLRESMEKVQERLADTDQSPNPESTQVPESLSVARPEAHPDASATSTPHSPPQPHQRSKHPGMGDSLASAVARANGASRFAVVRDSVTGEPVDALIPTKDRPLADAKNIYTVRFPHITFVRMLGRTGHEARLCLPNGRCIVGSFDSTLFGCMGTICCTCVSLCQALSWCLATP